MHPKAEVAVQYIKKAQESLSKLIGMRSGQYDGGTMGKQARAANASLQDATRYLESLGADAFEPTPSKKVASASATEAKSQPVVASSAPVFISKVVLNELGGDCPVCGKLKDTVLLVLVNEPGKPSRIDVTVCFDCLVEHKSAALHGTRLPPKSSAAPLTPSTPDRVPEPVASETPSAIQQAIESAVQGWIGQVIEQLAKIIEERSPTLTPEQVKAIVQEAVITINATEAEEEDVFAGTDTPSSLDSISTAGAVLQPAVEIVTQEPTLVGGDVLPPDTKENLS